MMHIYGGVLRPAKLAGEFSVIPVYLSRLFKARSGGGCPSSFCIFRPNYERWVSWLAPGSSSDQRVETAPAG